MDTQRHRFTFGILMAIGLALVPPIFLLLEEASSMVVVISCLGCLGWLFAGVLLFHEGLILDSVKDAIRDNGVGEVSGGLTEIIDHFVAESTRYHRAAYAFRTEASVTSGNLSTNLQRIAKLAYNELDARAVELSLFDEESGMWTQSMLIGDARTSDVQSMLLGEVSKNAIEALQGPSEEETLNVSKPVSFAGTLFGVLRVEFRRPRVLSKSDIQVLHLLATQGAVLLVDSRFTDELLRMRTKGEESVRAKTGFLANLSHEIRGPLGVILNGAELALDGLCGELTPALEDSLKMIQSSGEHLLDLVNDVLDYAKIEAGKISAKTLELPLGPLLEDMVTVVRSQAVSKGQTLTLDEVQPSWGVLVDKRHARQMLINFLTNAIKYTQEGGTIKVWAELETNGRVKVCIKDSGIGIPESEQHKVFGAFERVEDEYAMSQMGTGLGMPLTAKLAEVNGGAVGFESTLGQGSTFWLTLPYVDIADYQEIDSSNEQVVALQGNGETILLVDHDEASRAMLSRYLDSQGFKTVIASSGPEMIRALRSHQVDVAIVENDFPDLPGEEMVSMIRATPRASAVPIILLSARAFVFDIERFLKLGVDRCLSKPVALNELSLTTRRLIDQSRSLEQPPTSH